HQGAPVAGQGPDLAGGDQADDGAAHEASLGADGSAATCRRRALGTRTGTDDDGAYELPPSDVRRRPGSGRNEPATDPGRGAPQPDDARRAEGPNGRLAGRAVRGRPVRG